MHLLMSQSEGDRSKTWHAATPEQKHTDLSTCSLQPLLSKHCCNASTLYWKGTTSCSTRALEGAKHLAEGSAVSNEQKLGCARCLVWSIGQPLKNKPSPPAGRLAGSRAASSGKELAEAAEPPALDSES